MINTVCDNALVTAYACEKKTIDASVVREVAQDLEISEGSHHMIRQSANSKSHTERSNGDEPGGSPSPPEPSAQKGGNYDPEAFHLFVKFVDKLRERG